MRFVLILYPAWWYRENTSDFGIQATRPLLSPVSGCSAVAFSSVRLTARDRETGKERGGERARERGLGGGRERKSRDLIQLEQPRDQGAFRIRQLDRHLLSQETYLLRCFRHCGPLPPPLAQDPPTGNNGRGESGITFQSPPPPPAGGVVSGESSTPLASRSLACMIDEE